MSTVQRSIAAISAILTALLLQATLVAPLTVGYAVSLPAVVVCAVALTYGMSAALSFSFITGLLADLGSAHAAGVLALLWLGLGIAAATLAPMVPTRRARILVSTVLTVAVTGMGQLVLGVLGAGTVLGRVGTPTVSAVLGTCVGDLVLSVPVLAAVVGFARVQRVRQVSQRPELAARTRARLLRGQ